jgi:hypothetical protein
MPKGPSGQKRKADVIGNAVLVMKIAMGAGLGAATTLGKSSQSSPLVDAPDFKVM